MQVKNAKFIENYQNLNNEMKKYNNFKQVLWQKLIFLQP